MTSDHKPVDLSKLSTYSATKREHKASAQRAAALPAAGCSAAELLDSLPPYLGASAFHRVVDAVVAAHRADRPVVLAFGAHVIKVGCSPIVIDLIDRGIVTALACNGACAIHDVELAALGETSEEVADTIRDGSFGMVQETFTAFDRILAVASEKQRGLGRAVGEFVLENAANSANRSIFAAAAKKGIPATVHVALGTDTVHMSAGATGAQWGEATMHDFRLICSVVTDLGAGSGDAKTGGVWINVGSAVLLPEVFLKAVSVARNLGANLDAMTTANFDMIRHYRPGQNVVTRPVTKGRGFEVIGHHEILLPLLRQAILEKLAS